MSVTPGENDAGLGIIHKPQQAMSIWSTSGAFENSSNLNSLLDSFRETFRI